MTATCLTCQASTLPGVIDRLRTLPKAEVHIHLEGCISPTDAVGLATAAGVDLPRSPDQLFDISGGLTEFLHLLDWICGLVQTRDQLADLAYRFAQREAAAGCGYADVIVNPTHWSAWRSDIPGFVDALDAGFKAAEQDGLPPVGLCVSLLRTQTAAEAADLVDLLVAIRSERVVALSVDGNEATSGRTGTRFADAFRRAGAAGLRRTVHAGESSGPNGVRDAVELLGADRIDHGIRAIEDAAVLGLLAERQIPLGVCPTSNLTLGLYATLAEHPIDRLRRAQVPVSVNTDDPALLGIDLLGEYERCAQTFGWDDAVLRSVATTSVQAAFCNEDTAGRLLAGIATW